MNRQPDDQPAVQTHRLFAAAAALGEKRVAGAELTSCDQPMRPVCQPTELYGEHRDSAQVLSTPVQRQFSGYEACDLVELAYFGGALLGDRSLWTTAAYPLITQIECRVRGLESHYGQDVLDRAVRQCSALKRNLRMLFGLQDKPTDLGLIEMCRERLERCPRACSDL